MKWHRILWNSIHIIYEHRLFSADNDNTVHGEARCSSICAINSDAGIDLRLFVIFKEYKGSQCVILLRDLMKRKFTVKLCYWKYLVPPYFYSCRLIVDFL